MALNRQRYVTICQQFMVTAVVAAVGLSAAGVMTLQIVTPESIGSSGDAVSALDVQDAYVDSKPVTPKVREVAVTSLAEQPAAARTELPPAVTKVAPGKKLAAVSAPTTVHGYATVGVTWTSGADLAEDDIAVQVRTKKNGRWSSWTTAQYHDEHGPDAGSAEARAEASRIRPGTDAVVIGDVDQVQMRAQTSDGTAPADLELAIVDPGEGDVSKAAAAIDTAEIPAGDAAATSSAPAEQTAGQTAGQAAGQADGSDSGDTAALMSMKNAPKPYIFSRGQWGANESLRDKDSLTYGTVRTGFVHHTVNANDYSEQQVPALIRGIYAYHTQSRGWSDIGYNFLVDRFGRIWEGRYGGVDRPVVGAHTLGYNEYSFAMSAIGDFDKVRPSQAVLNAYAKLFAWKLSLYDIPADKTGIYVKNRYLNAINGHRDVGQTACPGRYLYARLTDIRKAARTVQVYGHLPGAEPVLTGDPVNWPLLAPPEGTVAPTDALLATVAQPPISFPKRISLTGSLWPDLALKSPTGRVILVPTDGMLGYSQPVRSAGTWNAKKYLVALGDVTGDGKADVLATNLDNGYARIYPTDGRGHVATTSVAGTSAFKNADLVLDGGDVNRDGKRDLISRDRGTHDLLLRRGLGKGAFSAPTVLRKAWPFSVTTATDFDRDGKVDLLAVRSDNTLVFARGTGSLTTKYAFKVTSAIRTLPRAVSSITAGPDSTGDAKRDLLVRWASGRSSLFAGDGAGGVGQEWGQFNDTTGLTQVSGGQLSGSGAMDLLARDSAGRLLVLPGNGKRNVSSRIVTNLSVPGATQLLNVGDWTRNGIADLIVRDTWNDRLVLYPGVGGGKFGRGHSLGRGWKSIKKLAAVGDVTGDKWPDLMGRVGDTGVLRVFPGHGVRAIKPAYKAPDDMRTYNQIGTDPWGLWGTSFGSLDGGFVPLVGATLTSALRMANGAEETGYDAFVGLGDTDGDGVADVLAREKGTGTLWMLPGKTSGGVQPRMWVANGFAGYRLIS